MPTLNDTTNKGVRTAENAAVSEGADLTFDRVLFGAYSYNSRLVLVSLQLLQDSGLDPDELIIAPLAERLARIINEELTTGTGSGSDQPNGIVTASTLGVTAAASNAVTYPELVDLEFSVNAHYRARASWMLGDTTWKAIRNLVDTTGRPLWQPTTRAGERDRFNGYEVYINPDMPAMSAGNKPIVFGDLGKYTVRLATDSVGLIRLAERYAEFLQVGFIAYLRADGNLADAGTHPVKHLALASS